MIRPSPLFALMSHLPSKPPAIVFTTLLNRLAPRLWPDEDFSWMENRVVGLAVTDFAPVLRITRRRGRFSAADGQSDVEFRASLADYVQMMARREDPDTLFFQRRLSITGDTELGLALKNLLDATDWSQLPAGLAWLVEKLAPAESSSARKAA